jgi:hypothetical protein
MTVFFLGKGQILFDAEWSASPDDRYDINITYLWKIPIILDNDTIYVDQNFQDTYGLLQSKMLYDSGYSIEGRRDSVNVYKVISDDIWFFK